MEGLIGRPLDKGTVLLVISVARNKVGNEVVESLGVCQRAVSILEADHHQKDHGLKLFLVASIQI